MSTISLADVQAARRRIDGRVHLTPTVSATLLGRRVGAALWLKCESLQKTGSFKVRGALNRVAGLDEAARARGVITVSAGNHAQALAWAARDAGVRCTVVMPRTATRAKVEASRAYGATIVQHGESGIEAFARAFELAEELDLAFVHPFEDAAVAAGQGTVGLELLEQLPAGDDPHTVIVPIGGGGLIAGVATAIKTQRPRVRVVGVEPEGAAVIRRSLDAGRPVHLDAIRTIADGLAAPMAGEMTLDVIRRLVDDVVLVTDDEIAMGLRELLAYAKLLAEPAGAAATAALLAGKVSVPAGARVVSVVSGGNVDLGRVKALL